ncbi:hypothetical protein BpHYR1_009657 [Brachionus plicatilis]|uniref:Uncharacterized protein n=1 Tax=Brachionus plicatilis TaxID=10195 RepID=A0A3M7PRR0_BRAPC|nr:hypothetical protein BpHYR1_009657 [Brachionus plicatilis]
MKLNTCDSCKQSSLTLVLDCGFRVCGEHFESTKNGPRIYPCRFCQKKHKYEDSLKLVANEITVKDCRLEKTIHEIGKRVDDISKIKEQKDYFRGHYYQNIRQKIEMRKDEILSAFEFDLNNYFNRVLDNLNKVNSHNEEKIKKNVTFNQLDHIKSKCDEIMDEKENTILSEKLRYLNESRKIVDSFYEDLESLNAELEKIKTLEFIEEKDVKTYEFKECFGKFKYENNFISETGEDAFYIKAENEKKITKPVQDPASKSVNLKNLKEWSQIEGHCGRIANLGELSNGDLVSGSDDGLIKIWNLNDGSCRRVLTGTGSKIKCFKVLPNDTIAACSDAKRSNSTLNYSNISTEIKYSFIRIYDPVTGSCEKTIQSPSAISSIEYIDNETFVTGHEDGSIYFCNKQSGEYWPKMENSHNRKVFSLIKLNDENLVSSAADDTIKIWNLKEKKCIKTYNEYNAYVYCLVKLSDKQFLSGSQYGTIKLWDITQNKSTETFDCSQYGRKVIGIHVLDEDKFISCSEDGSLVLWSLKEGKLDEKTIENNSIWPKRVQNVYFYGTQQIVTTSNDAIKIYSFE